MRDIGEFISVLACALFTGAAVYVNLVEHPARMQCGVETAATEFPPSYRRGTVMQAASAAVGLLSSIAAWLAGRRTISGLRFHDLRHHAITELAESQASDRTIMSIAGHVSQRMLAHSSHVRVEAKRKALDALAGTKPNGYATKQVTKQVAIVGQVSQNNSQNSNRVNQERIGGD